MVGIDLRERKKGVYIGRIKWSFYCEKEDSVFYGNDYFFFLRGFKSFKPIARDLACGAPFLNSFGII